MIHRYKPSRLLATLVLGAMAMAFQATAAASDWAPSRPVRLVVPSTAGAGADITARLFSERLATALGQPVFVDNKGGAGGVIGTEAGAKSAPDGHTIVFGSDYAFTIFPQLRKPPYDPIKDFEPISLVVNLPMVLVANPSRISATHVKDLIASAKASPGKLSIASAGNGSSHHMAAESFKFQAGVELLHVPYKGASEAIADVVTGQADMMFVSPVTALPHIKAGRLRPLAVSVNQRVAVLPDVPTLAEAGLPNYNLGIWMGFFYPARTPKAAIERVNAELQRILATPEVRSRIADMGYAPAGGPPEVLAQRLQSDSALYRKLIQEAKIKAD